MRKKERVESRTQTKRREGGVGGVGKRTARNCVYSVSYCLISFFSFCDSTFSDVELVLDSESLYNFD